MRHPDLGPVDPDDMIHLDEPLPRQDVSTPAEIHTHIQESDFTAQTLIENHGLDSYGYWRLPGETPELYRRLGAAWYKKWVPTTGDFIRRKLHMKVGGLDHTRSRLDQLDDAIITSKVVESVHISMAALIEVMHVSSALNNNTLGLHVAAAGLQMATNIYPIMAQRYNRLRAYRTLGKIANQEQA